MVDLVFCAVLSLQYIYMYDTMVTAIVSVRAKSCNQNLSTADGK